ncbi:MAG: DNA translocase FtsK [Cyclobacteriaceae bacterium]|nr:DNA translocase FtsK [Cyclobacteriaceae bacterium]MCX7638275.1 DNA translocase FtsK [Cyclobacteriaceae bacterium]MDW8332279.1 DNA translocase FtsK 4TM domain-containing protein [Cyclobacteriaceae bacterium]
MAENTYKSNTFRKPERKERKKKNGTNPLRFFNDPRFTIAIGLVLLVSSLFLLVSFISYLFTGKADMSLLVNTGNDSSLMDTAREAENWLGYVGAWVSHQFIYNGFGISSFFIPPLLFFLGFKLAFKHTLVRLFPATVFAVFIGLWLCLLFGYISYTHDGPASWSYLGGRIGYLLAGISHGLLGWGTFMLLALSLFIFIIFFFNITSIPLFQPANPKPIGNDALVDEEKIPASYTDEKDNWPAHVVQPEVSNNPTKQTEPAVPAAEVNLDVEKPQPPQREIKEVREPKEAKETKEPDFIIEERTETDEIAGQLVEEQGVYDPTLELKNYKFPPLELLNEYDNARVQVTQEELNQNKDKIVATLTNFKIGITSIKATIGPTVTLYEIVPDAGIKISRIKNLEDDIALSLSALGIRIIAPIPGKGTIGIEVPNKNREMVGIRSVLATQAFQKTDKELPVALGKTISNEVFVIDLAKMPHLLVAGATGQGKSVGLNVILTSLLYKRHPATLKFVLVDPKKVEMSLFSKIERHYLAKLPNSEEAIITDTRKVVHTLNSLCIEMENRYEILKDAGARNLKEYNAKFVARKLNPKDGHRFLPYIVLVIDELADLMMTAGKEVETPIARLAQLARAIGIHLVVATQRPSVNVITGVIKANFPARLSFRVTSKVDSRTILDTGGADQLVGMGDMLLSSGSDIIRLQCPFVDTAEIERICEYIGSQRGYDSAYLLPEFEDEDSGVAAVDLADRDVLFEEAARLIVMHQQGSTSLIQRKLKLGYNRAGRLIDQLEAAGIVGPFEGSKAREVLIKDEVSLEQLLNSLREKHG